MENTVSNPILNGRIGKRIIILAIPIMLSSLVQLLYNTVDAVIVGRMLGANALAAVGGSTSTAVATIVNFFTGIASGATIMVSQFYGAGDEHNVSRSVHNAMMLAIVSSVLVSVGGYFTSEGMLRLISTPEEIIGMAVEYMKIYFAGSATIIIYNIVAAIYRALGENRKVLVFIAIGCFANIGLDILFVGPLGMGVRGAALATVISQALSMVLSVAGLLARKDCCRLVPRKIGFDGIIIRKTLGIGIPSALQSVVFSYTNLLIGAFVNKLGATTASAWAAYTKLDAFFWMMLFSYAVALETFEGQNFGARLYDRCRKGLRIGMLTFALVAIAVEGIYIVCGRVGMSMFVQDEAVLDIGMEIIYSIVPFYFCFIPVQLFCSSIKGCGKTAVPSLVNVVGICVIRVVWLYTVPAMFDHSILSIMLAYGVSWICTSIILAVYYFKADIYGDKKSRKGYLSDGAGK